MLLSAVAFVQTFYDDDNDDEDYNDGDDDDNDDDDNDDNDDEDYSDDDLWRPEWRPIDESGL